MTPRVEFYVIEEANAASRLRLACRIAEKAYLAGRTVLIWDTNAAELAQLDELLWTFADRSFVPHENLLTAGAAVEAPVLLSAGVLPSEPPRVLINLADEVPGCIDLAERVADIIDGEESRRRSGRKRFRAYRERGIEPETVRIGKDG